MPFWRLIPLTATLFVLFLLGFQTDSLFSPKNPRHELHFWRKKKTNHFRLQIHFLSPPTVLFSSSQVSCTPACLRAFLCPRFSTASETADLPYLCVITHRVPFGSALRVGQTEECRLRPDSRELLAQTSSRTCAVLPSRPCARSHWDPIQLSRWDRGASSALSNGHNANYKPTHPPAQEPYFPFKCQNVKYNVWKWRADNLKPTQSAFVKCSVRKAWSMEDRTKAKWLLHNQTSANNLSDVQSCTCCLCWSQIIFSIKLFIKSYMIILSNTMMET